MPGDALVWSTHTALVTDTTATNIGFMEQNYGNSTGWQQWTDNVNWTGSTFGAPSGVGSAACWIPREQQHSHLLRMQLR